jgi:hypothetical protein
LKDKLKRELAIDEKTSIDLLDKKTFKTLEDNNVLTFNRGKLFSKKNSLSTFPQEKQLTRRNLHASNISETKSGNSSNLSEDEIELIISYRYSYDG